MPSCSACTRTPRAASRDSCAAPTATTRPRTRSSRAGRRCGASVVTRRSAAGCCASSRTSPATGSGSAGRRNRYELRLAEDRASGEAAPSPEAAALDSERRRLLLRAVDALPEHLREVVVCRHLLDLSEAETGSRARRAGGHGEVPPFAGARSAPRRPRRTHPRCKGIRWLTPTPNSSPSSTTSRAIWRHPPPTSTS